MLIVFQLFFQTKELDFAEFEQPKSGVSLSSRTFKSENFRIKYPDELIPAGLGFFQSDYDSSVKRVFHEILEMREPRFEYNFVPPYIKPWLTEVPDDRS